MSVTNYNDMILYILSTVIIIALYVIVISYFRGKYNRMSDKAKKAHRRRMYRINTLDHLFSDDGNAYDVLMLRELRDKDKTEI